MLDSRSAEVSGHACRYGDSYFWFFGEVRFKCALNSFGDYCKAVYRVEVTTEGLERYHIKRALLADVLIFCLELIPMGP